jgi:hypothetical protein
MENTGPHTLAAISKGRLFEALKHSCGVNYGPGLGIGSPAYKLIVLLGQDILPLILEDYRERTILDSRDPWPAALREITGLNPVKCQPFELSKIREDWLAWGAENGYLNKPSSEPTPKRSAVISSEGWAHPAARWTHVRRSCGPLRGVYDVIESDGTQKWYKDGMRVASSDLVHDSATWTRSLLHRDDDQPAIVHANGTQEWYKDDKRHREGDKPAIIYANGNGAQEWYRDGKRHREGDKPAIIYANGTQCWCKDGELHRNDDQPAVVCTNGAQEWYRDGKRHRDGDKPAIIDSDGTQWYRDGKRHRDGGPAIVFLDGRKHWYKEGKPSHAFWPDHKRLSTTDMTFVRDCGGTYEVLPDGQAHSDAAPSCAHEYVNVSFSRIVMACKHCGKAQ